MMTFTQHFRVAAALLFLAAAAAPVAAVAPEPPQAVPVTEDDLFNQDTIQDISLTLSERDWNDLKEKFTENTYYRADFRWRGITLRNIGIRSRGSASRSGTKPGLRLDFERYTSPQKFVGFKSLVLDNLVQDPTMVRERVAMKFFAEMGLPAPRVVHARLTVNNEFAGLYTIVEPVDKKFLKRTLNEDDGYLYEFAGTGQHYGFEHLGEELEAYAALFEPKTRESAPLSDLFRPLREMTRAFNETDSFHFVDATSEYLDIRELLTYLAVESFLAERDGILGEWGMNNFYLYRPLKSTRFQFLPWDRDTSFFDVDLSVFNRVGRNMLVRRLFEYPEIQQLYDETLRRCAEMAMREIPVPVSEGEEAPAPERWLEREVRIAYQQVRTLAHADPLKPFSSEEFEAETEKVLAFTRARAKAVVDDLARAAAASAADRRP